MKGTGNLGKGDPALAKMAADVAAIEQLIRRLTHQLAVVNAEAGTRGITQIGGLGRLAMEVEVRQLWSEMRRYLKLFGFDERKGIGPGAV